MVFNVEHTIEIKASIETVFAALTDNDGIKGWWGADTQLEKMVGAESEFKFADKYCYKIRVTDLVTNRRIEWKILEGEKQWLPTTIVWTLEVEDNGRVSVSLAHNHFAEKTKFVEYVVQKWWYFLESLRDYCETGVGKPWTDSEEAREEKELIASLISGD